MCDCEPNAFQCDTLVKARKEHPCCECDRPIEAGELYERIAVASDGSAGAYKTCLPCAEVRTSLLQDRRFDFDCMEFGALQATLTGIERGDF